MIGGAIHLVTGASIMKSLTYSAPVFGAFTVLFVYRITHELLKDRRIALLAAAFLAVNPLHMYQTSHAAPLTIGHFFMLLSLYLFLSYERRKRFIIPLIITSGLLIMSHHLTTYMYIITLTGVIFIRNLADTHRSKRFYGELIYLLAFSASAFSYWLLVAGRYFGSFIQSGANLIPQIAILFFYIGFVLLFLFTNVMRKYVIGISVPGYNGKYDSWIGFVTLGIIVIIMSFGILFITIPGTTAKISWKVILVSLPLICTISFVIIGLVYLGTARNRTVIFGWLGAILVSLILALISRNKVLFPDRHFEYLMEPLSIVAALGAYNFYRRGMEFRRSLAKKTGINLKRSGSPGRIWIRSPPTFRKFCMFIIVTVLVSNAISSYPMRTSLGGFNEEWSDEDQRALDWLKNNVDRNLTIASDHRLSEIIHGKGEFKSVTYEDMGLYLWYSPTWFDCYHELNMTNYTTKDRVEYVFIDNVMLHIGVQARVGVIPEPIDDYHGAWEKFMEQPFELVYINGTEEVNGVFPEGEEWTGKWAAVFDVNWTYIEANKGMVDPIDYGSERNS